MYFGFAQDYLRNDPGGRDVLTPVVWVKQGQEPPNFTGFFGGWDHEFWKVRQVHCDLQLPLQTS